MALAKSRKQTFVKNIHFASLGICEQCKFTTTSASSPLSHGSVCLVKTGQPEEAAISAQVARRGGLQLQNMAHTSAEKGKISPYLTLPANGEREGGERVAPHRKDRKVATSGAADKNEKSPTAA